MKRREGIVDYHAYVRINSTVMKFSGGKMSLIMDVNNLSGSCIEEVKFHMTATDDFEDTVTFQGEKELVFSLDHLFIEPAMRLKLAYETEVDAEPVKIELRVESVTFQNGEQVFYQKPRKKIYFYDAIEKDRYKDLQVYQRLCLYVKNPVCFAEKRTDGWLCVCGRLNRNRDEQCPECMSDRKMVLTQCTKEAIRGELHKEHEEYRRKLKSRRDAEADFERKRKLCITIFTVLCIALVILAGVYASY